MGRVRAALPRGSSGVYVQESNPLLHSPYSPATSTLSAGCWQGCRLAGVAGTVSSLAEQRGLDRSANRAGYEGRLAFVACLPHRWEFLGWRGRLALGRRRPSWGRPSHRDRGRPAWRQAATGKEVARISACGLFGCRMPAAPPPAGQGVWSGQAERRAMMCITHRCLSCCAPLSLGCTVSLPARSFPAAATPRSAYGAVLTQGP